MEPTFAENAAAEARGDAVTVLDGAFSALIEAWSRNDTSMPVALVVSIFDDLLAQNEELPKYGGTLRFDDISIDVLGVASMRPGLSASIEGLAQLMVRALGEDAPAHAWSMIARLSDEPPRDVEELRMWIRESLGAPAPHDELALALTATLPAPSPVLGSAEAALDFAEMVDEREHATEIIRTRSAPPVSASTSAVSSAPPVRENRRDFEVPILSAVPEKAPSLVPQSVPPESVDVLPTILPTQMPALVPASDPPEAALAEGTAVPVDNRPVVRVQVPKSNVRVTTAPAARRSAKPASDPRDSLRIPDDRPHWGAWVFVIMLVAIGVLFWLRYL
jgi:hypothetical protein